MQVFGNVEADVPPHNKNNLNTQLQLIGLITLKAAAFSEISNKNDWTLSPVKCGLNWKWNLEKCNYNRYRQMDRRSVETEEQPEKSKEDKWKQILMSVQAVNCVTG